MSIKNLLTNVLKSSFLVLILIFLNQMLINLKINQKNKSYTSLSQQEINDISQMINQYKKQV